MADNIEETEYEILCRKCRHEIGIKGPKFYGIIVFKGDFNERFCDRCEKNIDLPKNQTE